MDRLSRGRPGRSRDDRAAEALSGADRSPRSRCCSCSRSSSAPRSGRAGPGVLAAMLATLAFNYFFIPPLYTFTISRSAQRRGALRLPGVRPADRAALRALPRERLRLIEAERRDLIALTQLSQGFLADTNRESLLGVAADRLRQALQCEQVALLLARENGELAPPIATPGASFREDLAELAYRQGNSAAFPSDLGGTDIYLPIPVGLQRAGVLVARGLRSSERMAEACAAPARPRRRARAVPAAGPGGRGDAHERADEIDAARAARARPEDAGRRGARRHRELGGRQRRLGGLAPGAAASSTRLDRRIGELMDVVRLDSGAARPRPRARRPASEIVEAAVARFGDALAAPHALPRAAAAGPRGRGRPGAADRGARPRPRERRALLAGRLDDPRLGRRPRARRRSSASPTRARACRPRSGSASSSASCAWTTRGTSPAAGLGLFDRPEPRRAERRTAAPGRGRRAAARSSRSPSRGCAREPRPRSPTTSRRSARSSATPSSATATRSSRRPTGRRRSSAFEDGEFDLVVTRPRDAAHGRPRARRRRSAQPLGRPDPGPDRARRGAREGAPARRRAPTTT